MPPRDLIFAKANIGWFFDDAGDCVDVSMT